MRLLSIYLILFAFLFQIGNRLYVLVNFKLNQDYIAENLCEKKDEPESCCEGSCHLTQELNKVEEAEKQTPVNSQDQSKKDRAEEWPGMITKFNLLTHCFTPDQLQIPALVDSRVVCGYEDEIDHPPLS